jgi:hypothetical protein
MKTVLRAQEENVISKRYLLHDDLHSFKDLNKTVVHRLKVEIKRGAVNMIRGMGKSEDSPTPNGLAATKAARSEPLPPKLSLRSSPASTAGIVGQARVTKQHFSIALQNRTKITRQYGTHVSRNRKKKEPETRKQKKYFKLGGGGGSESRKNGVQTEETRIIIVVRE